MAIALVISTQKAGTGNSAGVDTSGATLLVCCVSSSLVSSSSTRTDLDSKSNTWTRIGSVLTSVNAFGMQSALYYVSGSPSVGSGHTFNDSAETTPAITLLAFSGTATSSQLDHNSELADQASVGHAGSITPTANNYVVVYGGGGYLNVNDPTVDSSYTLQETIKGSAAVNYSSHISYNIQTSASATNPGYTYSGNSRDFLNLHLASFKDSGGGGGATNWGSWITGNNWNRIIQNVR